MTHQDDGAPRLRLTATLAGGVLVLTTATGQQYATVPLGDVDPVQALLHLEEHPEGHHGGALYPLASVDRLEAALDRHGWRRTTRWTPHPGGASCTDHRRW
jgi:hypothetical protein